MTNFSRILLFITAVVAILKANSLLSSRSVKSSRSYNSGRLFAGKNEDVEEVDTKKGPGGKDVIRGILWATTPWIFNSYEVIRKSLPTFDYPVEESKFSP